MIRIGIFVEIECKDEGQSELKLEPILKGSKGVLREDEMWIDDWVATTTNIRMKGEIE